MIGCRVKNNLTKSDVSYGPALILRTEEREREGERKRGEREERKKGGKRVYPKGRKFKKKLKAVEVPGVWAQSTRL